MRSVLNEYNIICNYFRNTRFYETLHLFYLKKRLHYNLFIYYILQIHNISLNRNLFRVSFIRPARMYYLFTFFYIY